MENNTIIFIIAFLVVFVVVVKVAMSFSSEKKISKKRVSNLADAEDSFVQIQSEFGEEKTANAVMIEGLIGNFRNLKEEEAEISAKLSQAGVTSPNAPAYYFFFQTFGWLFGILVFGMFYLASKANPGLSTPILLIGGINALLLTFGAKLWLSNSIQKRQQVLTRAFPDTLDLLLVCVESGLALDAALARVCKELKFAHPEMTRELNRTRIELTMLNDREKALANLVKRTDMIGIKSLVAALLQSEKFGTSLIETLRVLSDDYRHTRMMVAEEKAGKLPAKIAVATLPFMLMALLIIIGSPAFIRASETL